MSLPPRRRSTGAVLDRRAAAAGTPQAVDGTEGAHQEPCTRPLKYEDGWRHLDTGTLCPAAASRIGPGRRRTAEADGAPA